MHRTIFSGGSTPSARAQRRKNRHGSKSYWEMVRQETTHQKSGPYFEPDDNQVPKADHTEFGCGKPAPSFSVFDGHHIHIMEDELHRQQTREETNGIRSHRTPCRSVPTAHLEGRRRLSWGTKTRDKYNHLPHEIVERDDWTGDIQRGVEDIREVI